MESRENLKCLVGLKYDYQKMRMQTSQRLLSKGNALFSEMPEMAETKEMTKELEAKIDKLILKELEKFPIYTKFLKDIKGVGPALAGVIISEINIYKATTVSKIWQYAGLNPGMIFGKKKIGGETVVTETLIRGDKLTAGYLAPYNPFLKAKLMGVLADCLIKAKSPYTRFYYNMKTRLEQEDEWGTRTKKHRDMAAKRYMIKMFICDLYAEWRSLEGLSVRVPYQEEYLGHKHMED